MGKAKKAHRKKVQNRNKRKKDHNTYISRLRVKLIQEEIKRREAEKLAKEEAEAKNENDEEQESTEEKEADTGATESDSDSE